MAEEKKTLQFWLRHEVKPGEERVMLVPKDAAKLLAAGHQVSVERSPTRCISDEEYEKAGCTLVDTETWKSAPKDTIILGLKELPENDDPLEHRHIYFAHCFKRQGGWKDVLTKFTTGGGKLWDLEFLVDPSGRRVAAFGRPAGVVGMAVGLLAWAAQHLGEPVGKLSSWMSTQKMVDEVKAKVDAARAKAGLGPEAPSALVIGALGRCGGGACWFAQQCGVTPVEWDMAETKAGGPFEQLLKQHILVNCIYLSAKIPSFLTKEMTDGERELTVFVDVSCDTTNPNNPFPIYSTSTTLFDPVLRVNNDGDKILDVVAIDHLPSLVPVDSSEGFSELIVEHVLQFVEDPTEVWKRALDLFNTKVEEMEAENKSSNM